MLRESRTRSACSFFCYRLGLGLFLLAGVKLALAGLAQEPNTEGPWFGVPLPPLFEPHAAPAIIGDRGPVPAIVPPRRRRVR